LHMLQRFMYTDELLTAMGTPYLWLGQHDGGEIVSQAA